MATWAKIVLVVVGVVVLAASATAPTTRKVQTSASVPVGYDLAWEALIDLFDERGWSIQGMDKASGLITTDWLSLGSDAEAYADCGSAPLAQTIETAIRFNVRVKGDDDSVDVNVNTAIRTVREFDGRTRKIDCVSTGAVEQMIHQQVQRGGLALESRKKSTKRQAPVIQAPASVPAHRGFYCATSTVSPAAGFCVRAKADCARTRDAAIVAVPDLTECALVETAWCMRIAADDDRCFPAEDVCGAAVVRLGATAECREVQ